jgi:hypothetical protein
VQAEREMLVKQKCDRAHLRQTLGKESVKPKARCHRVMVMVLESIGCGVTE